MRIKVEKLVLAALVQESDRMAALITELGDRDIEIPEHLLDQAVVVANVIKMIQQDGLIPAVMALATTYPLPIFEEHFTVMEESRVTRR